MNEHMLSDWAEERVVANVVMMCDQITQHVISAISRPSAIHRPELFIDGNQYCFLLGKDLQSGVAGFGETPELAAMDFDKNFKESKLPSRKGDFHWLDFTRPLTGC